MLTPIGSGSVAAVHCPAGHATSPDRPACRVCARPVQDRTVTLLRRPRLGALCRSGTADLPVSGPILLGRQPVWEGAGPAPVLVPVGDDDPSVSRTHALVDVDGWDVTVTDLGSRNGTAVSTPTGELVRLEPRRPRVLEPNSVLILSAAVRIWFEVS